MLGNQGIVQFPARGRDEWLSLPPHPFTFGEVTPPLSSGEPQNWTGLQKIINLVPLLRRDGTLFPLLTFLHVMIIKLKNNFPSHITYTYNIVRFITLLSPSVVLHVSISGNLIDLNNAAGSA